MENYTENDVVNANRALQMLGYVAKIVTEPSNHLSPEQRLIVLIQQKKYPFNMDNNTSNISVSSSIQKLSFLYMNSNIKALIDKIINSMPSALITITPEIESAVHELTLSQFLNASFTGERNIKLPRHEILDRLRHPHCFPTVKFLLEMQEYISKRSLSKCDCTYCNTSVGFGAVCSCGACAHFDCISQLLPHENNLSCLVCSTAWPTTYITYVRSIIKYS